MDLFQHCSVLFHSDSGTIGAGADLSLFYTFTPLEEGEVGDRIHGLLVKEKVSVMGIFSFNLSKNTRKANAGFSGIGQSRRIILSDTLSRNSARRKSP